mgnify:CR=1 FL=1
MRDSVDMHDDDFDPDSFEELEGPSKSQRKRDATALQDLGAQLVKLTSAQLNRIPLPDDLLAAVRAAQAMPQRGAHKRQLQYIGKLMRVIEPEPIRTAIAAARGESAGETAKLHRLEKLRDDLLADEKVLHEIASQYPQADLQQLRSLRRAALKEREQNKPPKSFRTIFQFLKTLEDGAPAEN